MPIVHVNIIKGRRAEQKTGLAKAITDAVVEHAEVRREAVRVLIHEVEPDHWFAGGEPKSPPEGS